MKRLCSPIRPILFGVLWTIAEVGYTHDPGLSTAELRFSRDALLATITFATRDIEALAPIDTNHDGRVSSSELRAANRDLHMLAGNLLRLSADGRPIVPLGVAIGPGETGTLEFRLQFPPPAGAGLDVHVPILNSLARGHRQHLTLRDDAGELLQHSLLVDREAATIRVQALAPSAWHSLGVYLWEGVWHIWIGLDHILFLVILLLPAVLVYRRPGWRASDIFKIVTAFAIAHSITLALAVLELIRLPEQLVESAIALSVLLTAVNNIRPVLPFSPTVLAFFFGLVHGLGFANVLLDLTLPSEALAISLLGFNLGVEAGQIAIVALLVPIAFILRHHQVYQSWVLKGGSTMVAFVAVAWFVERAFRVEILGS